MTCLQQALQDLFMARYNSLSCVAMLCSEALSWNAALRRYSREELEMIDQQGRCVITDHGAFVIFNLYAPAVTDINSPRFSYKMHLYEVSP